MLTNTVSEIMVTAWAMQVVFDIVLMSWQQRRCIVNAAPNHRKVIVLVFALEYRMMCPQTLVMYI